MRTAGNRVLLLILLLPLAGCPFVTPQNRTFTSADTGQGGFFGDLGGAEGAGDGESPAVDDGGAPREVVEPDVIRREGNLLYVLNQYRGLTIVDLDTETLLAQVPTLGYPRDLYFTGGQAYVLVGYVEPIALEGGIASQTAASRLYAVDVSNPAAAAIRSSIDLTGDLVDSRLVGEVLYTVTAEYRYGYYGDVASVENATSTSVTGIDVSNPDDARIADQLEFDGSGTVIHVTPEFAFVAAPDWAANETAITVLDITDPGGTIQNAGTVRVRGYLGDQYKMDAWNGALRVVTSGWQGQNEVYVSTYDLTAPSFPKLAELRLEGAEGETLFATRFDGPRAYVVTFFVIDPLFVLDLSDPADPRLLGALEVPGYSTHIEPHGDRLIALGVDDTDGRKVSVSIFDVSGDAAPSLVDRVSFGEEWVWSTAHQDVKALTILDDVIMVPFSGWSGQAGGFERLQFISYTADSLQLRGAVDLSGSILRSFDYDAWYYGVTTEQVTRIDGRDLDNPVVAASVTIAENLVDYLEFGADLRVEVVDRYDEGQIVVRTLDGAGAALGELALEGGSFLDAYPADDALVIVGVVWDDSPSYIVSIVALADPAVPAIRASVDVDVHPFTYYYGYGYGGPEIDVGVPGIEPGGGAGFDGVREKDVAIGYPYYYDSEDRGFLLGDTLVLRCLAERFDRTIGGGTAYQGLALVDIAAGELESTVGLGYEEIVSLDAVGEKLYLGTKESLGAVPFQRAMAAYYIQELDVPRGTDGPAVNVPGVFVQYDPAADVLTLRDHQWATDGSVASSLKTVRWTGGALIELLDSATITSYSGQVLATDNRIYFDRYDAGYQVQQATVNDDGAITLGSPLSIPGFYGNLIGARGDDVFVGQGYSAIGHFTFSGGTGTLVATVPVSGYAGTVRFGSDTAYFPLGYYGLVTIPTS